MNFVDIKNARYNDKNYIFFVFYEIHPLFYLRPYNLRWREVATRVSLCKFRFKLLKVSLKLYYFKLHFELYALSVDCHNVHYWGNEKLLFASHSTCWWVYIPPHFIFSSYDQVFRTYAVLKSESACVHYAVTVFPSSLKIAIRSIGPYHVLFRCLQDGV